MTSTLTLAVYGFFAMVLWMSALWAIHLAIKNAGIVDVGWAGGLSILAFLYSILGGGYAPRRVLVAAMAGVWGLRLASHILFDRVIGKPEDERYQTLRNEWKSGLSLKFFLFFEFQGLLDVVLAIPFLVMAANPAPHFYPLEIVGSLLWLVAVLGESLADSQLKAFKKDPANKGKVCQVGLWNYSRHANYFFEWFVWIAFVVTASSSPYGLLSMICPVLMGYFLFKVTGIPATEAQAVRSRGEAYREYQRTTSAFVPWPKKRSLHAH